MLTALLLCLAMSETATLDSGLKLHYKVSGAGEPLLLVGGLGSRLEVFDTLVPYLEGYKVYRFDHRGMGQSGDLAGDYTLDTMADEALELMSKLGIEQFHIAGISLGGMIAQHIALKHPKRLKSVILMATTPGGLTHTVPDDEVLQFWRQMMFLPRQERVERGLNMSLGPEWIDANPEMMATLIKTEVENVPNPMTIQRQTLVGMTFDYSEKAAQIEVPTLIIHGEKDRIVPIENGRRLHRMIKHSYLEVLPKSGHRIVTDAPQETASRMIRFLKNQR